MTINNIEQVVEEDNTTYHLQSTDKGITTYERRKQVGKNYASEWYKLDDGDDGVWKDGKRINWVASKWIAIEDWTQIGQLEAMHSSYTNAFSL